MEVKSIEESSIGSQTVKGQIDAIATMPIHDLADSPTIIIEEISRNYKVINRYKLTKENITIGRGYDNDIILSDPHTCPNHLHIDFVEGSWKISDQKSINGCFLEEQQNKNHNADQHVINDGDIISVGKSQLRLLFVDHPVAPTIQLSTFENFINLMRHPLALFISVALFISIAGGLRYLSSPIESNYSQFFVNSVGMALVFALWPGGVALVSHLTKHDARIMVQLGVSFVFFNLMWCSDFINNIIVFNSANHSLVMLVTTLLPITLAFCLFWLNCYIGFHMSARRKVIVAASITALLFGGSYLVQYSHKPEFNPHPQYNATIMSPSFLLVPSSSVDQFIDDNNLLFEKASKAAGSDSE
jgi:hypothetical protein